MTEEIRTDNSETLVNALARIEELEKRLNEIELLCYTDGSDGEVLAKIMNYFSKENEE